MIIRRIGVLSAAKVFGMLGLVLGFLLGLMMFVMTSLGGMAALAQEQSGAALMAGMGLLAIIVMPLIYGVFMFVAGAIQAFIYNVGARFVGGIEIEVE